MDDEIQNQPPPVSSAPDGWELMCAGVLSTEFGRRPSDAVANAMVQLAAEETGSAPQRQGVVAWWRSVNLMPRLVFFGAGAAVIALLAAGSWLIFGSRSPGTIYCTVTGNVNPQWAKGSKQPAVGASLADGTL